MTSVAGPAGAARSAIAGTAASTAANASAARAPRRGRGPGRGPVMGGGINGEGTSCRGRTREARGRYHGRRGGRDP